MTLNEADLKLFKKWLRSHLKYGPVTVTFTKKDGSERIMKCTTNPTYIMFKEPASVESKREKKINEDVMPVFDMEAGHWKSFRWDSIKSVSFTLGEEYEHSNETQR
jgi:WYL_2, Sm-like SH3 beta-barrel fold